MSTKRRYEQKARATKVAETRRRITEVTLALHGELGPARTTVAEVARRAGVQRLTVYNHFPEERDLLAACSGLFLARHPVPDVTPCMTLEDPAARLGAVLEAFYAWYRATEQVTAKVQRDAEVLPALAELLAGPAAEIEQLGGVLAAGFGRGRQLQAAVALALDFWAWRRLAASGLTDSAAAELMVGAVVATSSRR